MDYIAKGSNPWTEHHSAILRLDVRRSCRPGTQPNTVLIGALKEADLVAVAGEAGSHCLANTVCDSADHFGDDRLVSKIVLWRDATSPVAGFDLFQDDFLREMTARGMQLSHRSADFLA